MSGVGWFCSQALVEAVQAGFPFELHASFKKMP